MSKLVAKKTKVIAKNTKEKREEPETIAVLGEFKGKPTFAIHWKDRYENDEPNSFIIGVGLKKAKQLLKHLDELKEFVEEHDEE